MAIPTKPYELAFDERPNYLYVHVSSHDFSVDVALAYLRDVINECRELTYKRVLIVRDIPVMLTPQNNKFVAERLAGMVFPGLKIAVVEPHIELGELERFSAAASEGFGVNVKAFSTIPDARRWLLNE